MVSQQKVEGYIDILKEMDFNFGLDEQVYLVDPMWSFKELLVRQLLRLFVSVAL